MKMRSLTAALSLAVPALWVALPAPTLSATPATSAVTSSSSRLHEWAKDRIGDDRKVSLGGKAWLNGPQPSGQQSAHGGAARAGTPALGTNVDANDPHKDLAAGQSETAIAAHSGRVMAAWNDISGQFIMDSAQRKASGTGIGFSNDGGRTFTDLIGLPNNNPDQQWFGDPTLVAVDSRHFIVGSLYLPNFYTACSDGRPAGFHLAVSVATVAAGGSSVSFTNPIKAARGGNACDFTSPAPDLAFLDKEFLAYDASSRMLAMSYTRLFLGIGGQSGLGQIEVVRAKVPADPASLTSADFSKPIVVWKEEPCDFEARKCAAINTGSYPSVAPGGDIYVAWERNFFSNLPFLPVFGDDPRVYIHAALVPARANRPSVGGQDKPRVVTQGQINSRDGGVKSLDTVFIAGYSRGIGNDFPRIAVNASIGKVIIVWNDGSAHPLGDIWLRALPLDLATRGEIHRVNDKGDSNLHFLPALSVGPAGAINVSWYDRRLSGSNYGRTDYFGERRATPGTNGTDFRITTGSSDWTNTSSLIDPNFGDYSDNATDGSTTYYIWSDGRLGTPQPFVDSR